MSAQPRWINRRTWYSPRFQLAYRRAARRDRRLIERPCPEGNCTDLVDPKDGRLHGGWGPTECPCDDTREFA